ncbi:MAG: hypothetical protein NTY19_24965 [Planctomycetota bacterium]|nr:hypothetical protein [Planctomycetota bacterium]
MKRNHSFLLAAATMLLLPTGRLLAEDADPADAGSKPAQMNISDLREQPILQVAETAEQFAGTAPADNVWLEFEEVEATRILGARLGWWGTFNSGSLTKTGEYQGLHPSSPFLDFDGLISNGNRTLDFFATMPENETSQLGLHFYNGPGLTANVDYERFLHRLDHKPLNGFPPTALPPALPGPPANGMWGEDFNLGQDYAMHVQQLKANFKGDITENIKWRLNVWGMEKEGMRQANAVTHCYQVPPPGAAGSRCHLVSNAQRIDWLTMEIEPVIEVRLTDWMSVEYSRTMRQFQQNDSTVLNNYTAGLAFPTAPGGNAEYARVPDSYTEIDRLKLAMQLGTDTDAYVIGHVGNTENQYRDINRRFGGVDGRITNRSLDGLELTGYGKVYSQDTTTVPYLLNGLSGHPLQGENLATYFYPWPPIDRDFATGGVKGRWRPFLDECGTLRGGLALTGGYEYNEIVRRNAGAYIEALPGPATQPNFFPYNTSSNKLYVGAEQKWTDAFTSNLRYTLIATRYPLLGITPEVDFPGALDAALNTNLPTHEDRIEIGGTWNLADNFMLNGQFWLERTYNDGQYSHFNEDNYPFMVTAWYSPTNRWSVSGGYAQLTNWITQDITLGGTGNTITPFTQPWNYAGQSDVVTLSTSYATTERLTLTGGLEYVHGRNAITSVPTPTGVTPSYSDPAYNLASYSRVDINTWRLSAGVDYLLRQRISSYFRYNYFDYGDATQSYNSGTTSNVLAGLTGTY